MERALVNINGEFGAKHHTYSVFKFGLQNM